MITIVYIYTGNDRVETESMYIAESLLSTVLTALLNAGVKIVSIQE